MLRFGVGAVLSLTLVAGAVHAAEDEAPKATAPAAPAGSTETPAAVETAPKDVAPVEAAVPQTPPTATEGAVTPPKAEDPPKAVPLEEPKAKPATVMSKVGYILMHSFMGGMVALAAVEVVVMLVAAPVLYALPTTTPLESQFPERWRRAVAIGLLGGVVPGLAVVALLGVVATGVSAVRNVGMFTGE